MIVDDQITWPPAWASNRLEAVVLPHHPEVSALKALLREGGGSPVLMSGSGASVFAVVSDEAAGQCLAALVRESGAFAAVVTTLSANPILAAAGLA